VDDFSADPIAHCDDFGIVMAHYLLWFVSSGHSTRSCREAHRVVCNQAVADRRVLTPGPALYPGEQKGGADGRAAHRHLCNGRPPNRLIKIVMRLTNRSDVWESLPTRLSPSRAIAALR
jgi:hypothetical protein